MIINANRKELLAHVKKAAKAAAPPGHPVKALSGALIEADGRSGVTRITATNLETAIRSTMPVSVEQDGSAVIDAKLLHSALDLLPGEDVYMELKDNGQLYMSSDKSNYQFAALPGEDYPKVEIPYPGDTVAVKGLKSLITRSAFAAASPNPASPTRSCVKITFSETGVSADACDGVCAVRVIGDPECKGDLSLLVPAASLKLLASLASDSDVFELGVTGTGSKVQNVVISDGTMLFSTKTVEGNFLDIDAIFNGITPVASAKAAAEKLRRALDDIISISGTGGISELSFAGNGLQLLYSGPVGNASTMLEADVGAASTEKYYYSLKQLYNCAKLQKGVVELGFAKDKMLELRSDAMRYIQIGMRHSAAIKNNKEAA